MRKRMPYNNMRNNNMNRGNNRNNNNMRRPMRGGFDDEEIHPRQRKHAQNMREKYLNQARDAQINGDRVQAEYWLQHAEHYSRILNAINEMFAPTPQGGEEASGEGSDDAGGEAHNAGMGSVEGDDAMSEHGQPHHQPRQHRQPRRPYQGQPQEGGQEQGQQGQRGGGRGQWRQPRERRPEQGGAESAPAEDMALPLAAVLPAARMDDDDTMA